MRALASLLLALLTGSAEAAIALDQDVTPASLAQTICRVGYTASVRPSVAFTNRIKYRMLAAAGLPLTYAHLYELDHIVPLTLGGAPRSLDNLQLQKWVGPDGARVKDKLEVRLNHLVCAGKLPLSEAQACIYSDWQACAKAHPSIQR